MHKPPTHPLHAGATAPASKEPVLNQPLASGSKAYWAWGSLIFSLFFFFPMGLGYQPITLSNALLHLLVYVAFLVCYGWGITRVLEQNPWPPLGIIAIAVIGTALTPGTNAFFGYAGFFAGFGFSTRNALQGLVGNLMAQVLAAFTFDLVHVYYLGPSMVVTLGLFAFGFIERRERLHYLKEARSEEQIEQLAVIAERERIARDLHDLVGHSLSSIALKAELAEKLLAAQHIDRAQDELSDLAQVSRQTLSQIRQSVSGLKLTGINKHLQGLFADLEAQGFKVTSQCDVFPMGARVESAVILIVTEAITNVLRHSSGDQVLISLQQDHKHVRLQIADNGDIAQLTHGNGLQGIAQRSEALDGSLTVSTQSGMKLDVVLPREAE